ncbi:MAG TPA: pyridoxamine 5'-phosphate oxidase family protein [Stellaceae bacterium]|nr:pyridoxamine 5'-phosphate oxidase family protein [Stellaceae bacterium]
MHETPRALPAEQENAVLARSLLRRIDRAALATSLDGAPYVSLVLLAADLDAAPLLLLSDLAQHSRNLAVDPRVALLVDGTAGLSDPLTGNRLTVQGQATANSDPRLIARFTSRHPESRLYAGFGDFRLYRVAIERGHLVAGFGRIAWVAGAALRPHGDTAALAAAEPEILAQINESQAETVDRWAARLCGRAGTGWRMTGIDPEGVDLRRGEEAVRLDFPAPAPTPEAARRALAALAAAAAGRGN